MIHGLLPYPTYKDSGLPWLPAIPASWSVVRNGRLFTQRNKTGHSDLPILEVSLRSGVRVRDMKDGGRKQVMSDRTKYKQARAGDLAYNTMRMWQGAVGVAPVDGLVSPAYVVATPVPDVDAAYLTRLFRTSQYLREIDTFSRGIVKDRNRLYWEAFKQLQTPLPPKEEQVAIVRFLTTADRRVFRALNSKRALLARLEEQRQFIIRRAVTHGIDPHVRMKPSGVPWLGDVPAHWVLSRVRSEFECLNRHRVPLSSTERAAMKSRIFDYYGASGVIEKVDRYIFDEDLLLVAEDGANLVLRNLPLAIIARGKFWVNNHAHILRPRRGHIEFLAELMQQINYLPWISGAAQPKLTRDRLMGISIAVPSRDEQDRIVKRISEQTAPMRVEIERVRRSIALVREFHDRLVASLVTGAIDVRHASQELPQVEVNHDAAIGGEDADVLAADALVGEAEEVAT